MNEEIIQKKFLKWLQENNYIENTDMDFHFEETQISFQGRFLYKIFKASFEMGVIFGMEKANKRD